MPTFWPTGRDSRITDIVMQTSMMADAPKDRALGAFARLDSTSAVVGDSLSATEEHEQECFLSVHTVFCLIEDDGLRAVEHGVRYFGVAMSRQAVHEDCIGLSMRHQGLVDLIRLEDGGALGGFMFEAHAGANVGINRVGAGDGFDGIVQQGDAASGLLADLDCFVDDFELRREALGRGYAAMCSELGGGEDQRMTDVIAVSNVRKAQAFS